MTVRPLVPADLASLLALDAATNPHPWSAAQWNDSLANHLCLGLDIGGKLAGFAVALPLPDEAELLLIAVEPQGQGWGRQLLRALNDELQLRGLNRLLLEVRESNARARRFYTAAGFAEIGRRKNYYPATNGREDALIYSLETGR